MGHGAGRWRRLQRRTAVSRGDACFSTQNTEQLRTDRPDVGSADGRGSQGGGEDDCRQSCGRQLCGWWWRWRQLSVLQQQVRRTLDPRVLMRPTRQQWHLCRDARQASWTRPTDLASASQTTTAARWLMVRIVDRSAGDNCVAGGVKTPGKHLCRDRLTRHRHHRQQQRHDGPWRRQVEAAAAANSSLERRCMLLHAEH